MTANSNPNPNLTTNTRTSVMNSTITATATNSNNATPPTPHYTLATKIPTHTKPITSLKFAPTTTQLASASADSTVNIWNVQALIDGNGSGYGATSGNSAATKVNGTSTSPVTTLKDQHEVGINDIAWSSDATQLFTASDDKTIGVWDIERSTCIRVLRGHTHHVFTVSYSPTSHLLASGSYDETVKLWDLRSGKPARTLSAHSDPVSAVDISRDGLMLVTASYDGLCRIWDVMSGQCLTTVFADKTPPVSSARFTPNGSYVIAAYLDSTLRLWNYTRGACLKMYIGHTNSQYCVGSEFVMHFERKYICSGSECGRIFIWDVQSNEIVQKLGGDEEVSQAGKRDTRRTDDVALSVASHPTRPLIVSGGLEKTPTLKVYFDRPNDILAQESANVMIE